MPSKFEQVTFRLLPRTTGRQLARPFQRIYGASNPYMTTSAVASLGVSLGPPGCCALTRPLQTMSATANIVPVMNARMARPFRCLLLRSLQARVTTRLEWP